MKVHCLIIFVTLLVACSADPNIISDDDQTPIGPGTSLECDSLQAPNQIFTNKVGEMLVFEDSMGVQFDTLTCVVNSAINMLLVLPDDEYCQPQYKTAFSTKWLPSPEVYQLEFSSTTLPSAVFLSAQSVNLDDFNSSSILGNDNSPIYQDSVIINGRAFKSAFQYDCLPGKPCTFAQSFVFALNQGLVAFGREDKWWMKK